MGAMLILRALFLFLPACSSGDEPKGDTHSDHSASESDSGADSHDSDSGDSHSDDSDSADSGDSDSDSGADSHHSDSGDSGDSADSGDTGEPPDEVPVRFIVLGDGGEGNDAQYEVADVARTVCDAHTDTHPGCEFALYLGDNFYDDGVASVKDEQFQTKFELPYADLHFPFYIALGNHDYGELSLLGWKADAEVEYSDYSEKWTLPGRYHTFVAGNVQFIALDTNQIMLEDLWGDSGQADWIEDIYATSGLPWRVVLGHHPYRSNGAHGNAGEYEGYDWLPIADGQKVEDFMDEHLCGQIDVYFAGHDHTRQWLEPQCGMELIVSGAAAKLTALEGRGNPTRFEDDTAEGFMWVEIRGDVFYGEFWRRDGTMDFSGSFTRTR